MFGRAAVKALWFFFNPVITSVYTFHILANFAVFLQNYNFIVVIQYILYDLNVLKFIEACFMAYY